MALGATGNFARGQQAHMRDPAHVPQLQCDLAAGGVDRVGDGLPAGDLGLAVDARRVQVALAERIDLGGLGDDQAGAGTLAVVLDGQRRGHAAFDGPVASE